MRFNHDRRGQSVVVGTVILFGFLIVALALYQAQIVPMENADVEFEHSQSVENDVIDLRNSILSSGSIGGSRSTSVKLGTRYPQRTFFVNPAPSTGELTTSEPDKIRIENADVVGDENVEDFWSGRDLAFETRSVRYRVNYNEFRDGPSLVYEHSVVSAEFDQAILSRTGQRVVTQEDRVRLVTVDGDLSENGVERTSVDTESLSQNRRSVTIEPSGGTPVIELPTDHPVERESDLEGMWTDLLGDDVENVAVDDGVIAITLNESIDSYRLELAGTGVGFGAETFTEEDGYITAVSVSNDRATAEVRDRYNNPVQDADVEVIIDGTPLEDPKVTDEEGQVQYTVESGQEDVEMVINDEENGDWESVDFGPVGTPPSQPGEKRYLVEWSGGQSLEFDSSAGTTEVSGQVSEGGRDLDGATVDFATTNPSVAEFTGSDTRTTTTTGDFSTNLDIGVEGTATIFAASGDGVDDIQVEVVEDEDPAVPFGVFIQANQEMSGNQDLEATFDAVSDSERYEFEIDVDRSQNPLSYEGTVTIDGEDYELEEDTVEQFGEERTEIDILDTESYESLTDNQESTIEEISNDLDENSEIENLEQTGGQRDLEEPEIRPQ